MPPSFAPFSVYKGGLFHTRREFHWTNSLSNDSILWVISLRTLCWWALPCSFAIFLSVYLLPEPFLLPAGILCALGGFGALLLHGPARRRAALAAAGLAVGFLWTGCYGLLVRAPARELADETAREYTFSLTGFPKKTDWGASAYVRLETGDGNDHQVLLYAGDGLLSYMPGDRCSAWVKLSPSDVRKGEHTDYYEAEGIFLIGTAKGEVIPVSHPLMPLMTALPQWSAKALKDSISALFPADVSGFLTALLTGDKGELPAGLYAAFRRAGIAHVVAVSGLHIGFLAGLLALLFGKRNRLGLILSVVVIFFFVIATGSSPSALRSALMSSILLLAPMVGREDDKPTTLALALVVLLLLRPYVAASASLQLSFASVAGIYLVTGPLCERWFPVLPKGKSIPGKIVHRLLIAAAGNLAVTLGALLFSTPVAALWFHSFSLSGILTNLLTLWAVTLSFLGGLLAALLGLVFPPLGMAAAWVVAWPARWVICVARAIARLPFASLSLLSVYLAVWFVLAYGTILLWVFLHREIRPLLPLGAVLVNLCLALIVSVWPSAHSSLTATVLDVGQGASTLLYSRGHAVLVDCGGNAWEDAGDIAADHLQALGISHLDALVLSHYHADHANGVPELLERVEVSLLILPDVTPEEPLRSEILSIAESKNCEVELLFSDAHVTFGDVSMEIFEPLGSGGANEEGLSVLCTAGDFDLLITGDMNDVVEGRLLKYKSLPDLEALVVGHHGSASSTSEDLLLATTPEIAVISCGYNSYGHPTEAALERLGAAGCEIYRTDQMGSVTLTVPGTS